MGYFCKKADDFPAFSIFGKSVLDNLWINFQFVYNLCMVDNWKTQDC